MFRLARVNDADPDQTASLIITKTCLYNFDSLKPNFYIVKLGFTGVYIIFLFLLKNIDCGYSLEPPLLVVKFSVYLNRRVFVMLGTVLFAFLPAILRGLDTFGRSSTISDKGDNFCDFLFACFVQQALLKGDLL